MSSLIGQLPLAAVWLYCKDVNQTQRFYKDVVGLKSIQDEESGDDSGPHFDLGTVRLTLLPRASEGSPAKKNGGSEKSQLVQQQQQQQQQQQHLVFVVENSIEAVIRDLSKRGVKMASKKIIEDETGKTAWFNDPDGHRIYLWQPPKRDSEDFKQVEALVKHYESVSRAVADLRLYDEEARQDD